MQKLLDTIKDNALSIVLFAFFAICMVAQCFAGWRLQNKTLTAHGMQPIVFWQNMATGTFLEGLASNWQAAFLQFVSLILFSGLIYQRGGFARFIEVKPIFEQERRDMAARFS